MKPVVLTGWGTVGPAGAGREAFAERLATGGAARLTALPPLGPLGRPELPGGLHLDPAVAWAGRPAAEALRPWLPAAVARRMSQPSRLAVVAAKLALEQAGIPVPEGAEPPTGTAEDTTGVILATSFGPSSVTEGLLEQILRQNPEAASPFLFSESVANAPAAQVARLLGARGANLTLTQRQAGALSAIHQALREIQLGRSARVVVGAVDEVTSLLQALLDRFRALARGSAGQAPVARPFDRQRSGFVTGEGATVWVLENADVARARGARPLATVLAAGGAFDPTARRSGWGHGAAGLAASLTEILGRAGLTPADLDLVIAGAAGSRGGDALEAQVLRTAWAGAPWPPVVAPRGVFGELYESGLPTALVALGGGALGPSGGSTKLDPAIGFLPFPGGPLLRRPRRVLLSALGVGGAAAWVVLGQPELAP